MSQDDQYIGRGKAGEFDCIWMASKTIDYQVCVKDFDCENCMLDKILKNIVSKDISPIVTGRSLIETDFLDKIIRKLEDITFDSKIIYLKNNLVLKHLFANIYYIGLNPLALGLLDSIVTVKEYMKKVYFNINQTIIMLEGAWGQLTIKAPMNFLLLDKLNWTPEDIINRQWLALIVINQSEIIDAQVSSESWKIEKAKYLKVLTEYRDFCLKINLPLLSTNEKIKYLYQLTGKIEYLKLLEASTND
jgi:hypothetical protein